MNVKIFMETYTAIDTNTLFLKAATIDDDVATTLRLHLICEQLIESWICACAGKACVFGKGDDRLLLECSVKIEMAKNLNLPVNLYLAIKGLNALRNDIAHKPQKHFIPDSRIQSLIKIVDNYLEEKNQPAMDKRNVTVFDENEKKVETVTIKSDNSKNRLKLCLVFGAIYGSMMKEVASRHSGRCDNDYRQLQI